MKDLSKHIEYLLLDHECVVYPELGAFITSYISSKWSKEENLFLPPYRSVWFNPQLKEDDNLFISTLAHRYNISRADAILLCTEYLEEIYQELEENGTADIGSIGTFIKESEEAPMIFAPTLSGVATPSIYGLDSVQLPILNDQTTETQATDTRQPVHAIHSDEKHITIRIRRSIVNYAAAVAASIILFLGLTTPAYNTGMTQEQRAETEFFMPSNLRPLTAVPAQPEQSAAEDNAQPAVEDPEETEENVGTQTTTQETQAEQSSYAIVLASAISMKNAQNYVANLQSRGHNAEIFISGKMVRVIIPGFRSAEEVHQAIKQMQTQSSEFSKAWTLKL